MQCFKHIFIIYYYHRHQRGIAVRALIVFHRSFDELLLFSYLFVFTYFWAVRVISTFDGFRSTKAERRMWCAYLIAYSRLSTYHMWYDWRLNWRDTHGHGQILVHTHTHTHRERRTWNIYCAVWMSSAVQRICVACIDHVRFLFCSIFHNWKCDFCMTFGGQTKTGIGISTYTRSALIYTYKYNIQLYIRVCCEYALYMQDVAVHHVIVVEMKEFQLKNILSEDAALCCTMA